MPDPEDPLLLLEQLSAKYGVVEDDPLHGPSVMVPNSEYEPEWTRLLNQAGFKVYCGEQAGRVAWIIPLKGRLNKPASFQNQRRIEAEPSKPYPRTSKANSRGKGCITGRAWTSQEDEQILAMLEADHSAMEIARELAPKLARSEEAVKTRVLRLKHRRGVAGEPTPTREKPVESPTEKRSPEGSEPSKPELHSLLQSALFLAEDPKHAPALRLILEASLRLIPPKPGES